MLTRRVTSFAVTAALLAVVAAPGIMAHADDGHGHDHGKGQRQLVISGIITNITSTLSGQLLTIDRGGHDGDHAASAQVQVSSTTKIVPAGTVPAVGLKVHAVVTGPSSGGVYSALQLVFGDGRGHDGQKHELHACGTIATLPADPLNGEWTLTVSDIATYKFTVNGDTHISPAGTTPAVGQMACFEAAQTTTGWVAKSVELKVPHAGGGEHHGVEIEGVIKTLPDDRSGDWTLVVTVDGGSDVSILVNKDTVINGTLAVGAQVSVKAEKHTDSAGTETLVALKVEVEDSGEHGHGGGDHSKSGIVHVEGTVTAVSADGKTWTLTDEGKTTTVVLNDSTKIVGLADGQSPLNLKVEGIVAQQTDGTLLAVLLKVDKG
jgi:hypothetical protein